MGRILAAIAKEPLTGQQLSARLYLAQTSVDRFMRRLLDEKPRRLHICGHYEKGLKTPARIFKAGPGKDAVYVLKRKRPRPKKADGRRARILTLLALPQTAAQLAERLEMSRSRVTVYLRDLRQAEKIHITGSIPPAGTGIPAPVYALGNLPDKPISRRARPRVAIHPTPCALWAPMVHALAGSQP
jgi:DNA-binding transcriptional ArsR family regulator